MILHPDILGDIPDYARALNDSQRAAVLAVDGPVLVLAGAGTGKTRVLTTRIAHILATRRAFPGQILSVTFTNKAAKEMAERVAGLVVSGQSSVVSKGSGFGIQDSGNSFNPPLAGESQRISDAVGGLSNERRPSHGSPSDHQLPRRGGTELDTRLSTLDSNHSSTTNHQPSTISQPLHWLGTFHSIAAKILRRHAELLGLSSSFTILDMDDQLRLIKQVLNELGIDDKTQPPKFFAAIISRWKDEGLTPDKVRDNNSLGKRVYEVYQARLKMLNACDFGDLLLHNLSLFQQFPEILNEYAQRFKYILVDEYQDTNIAQYIWLRLLAIGHKNICCVGDDDQSIYGWRGAEVGNILKFEQDFPGATTIRLERNYRSTQHILGAASGLIAHNCTRLGKTLWTEETDPDAMRVRVKSNWDGDEEARYVGDEVEALQRERIKLSQMAILVRASAQTRAFEERFITLGIPYRVVGGLRFYERQEIKDVVAYLRVLFQPDDNLAFERIINTPKRGVGKGTLEQLHSTAREMNVSLYRALEAMVGVAGKDTERGQQTEPALSGVPYEMQQAFHGNNTNIAKLKGKTGEVLSRFMADLERWRKLLESMTLSELTETLIEESGYREMWMAEKSPDAAGRVENLRELVRALTEFETLTDFIEHVSLVAELADGKVGDMISLMTLHSAKGLEFDAVFLPGWEEGLFPHQRALDETGGKGLEEERRLAYVGITRARKKLYISHASNRRMYNQWQSSLPSRFLSELPAEHVDNLGGGNYGSRGSFADMRREMEAVFKGQGAGKNNYSPLEGESKSKSFNSKRFGEGTVYPSPQPSSSRGEGVTRLSSSSTANHQPSTSSFQSGTRVFHPKFGFGTVLQVEGKHLTVSFDEGGRKKVLSSFVARKGA